jgi:transcriptional regulator with XRE-family HTH domain
MATHLGFLLDLNMVEFAQRLKLLREARQISQARLAELLGIDPRSYNRWERGGNVPHLETLIRIADILQVTLDELVGRKDPSLTSKIRNHTLQALCVQADDLPDEEQRALILVMDGLIKKTQMGKVIGKSA